MATPFLIARSNHVRSPIPVRFTRRIPKNRRIANCLMTNSTMTTARISSATPCGPVLGRACVRARGAKRGRFPTQETLHFSRSCGGHVGTDVARLGSSGHKPAVFFRERASALGYLRDGRLELAFRDGRPRWSRICTFNSITNGDRG